VRLFVASIAYEVTDSELFRLFSDAGFTVASAKIAKTPDGESRGFGFVDIADGQAEAAIAMLDRSLVWNRRIAVTLARAQR
jgi:RNA recognition motif-containing protein